MSLMLEFEMVKFDISQYVFQLEVFLGVKLKHLNQLAMSFEPLQQFFNYTWVTYLPEIFADLMAFMMH